MVKCYLKKVLMLYATFIRGILGEHLYSNVNVSFFFIQTSLVALIGQADRHII